MLETNALTQSDDENDSIERINAIYEYVRNQRPRIGEYPGLLPLIADFEGWYQALEEAWSKGINLGVIATRHIVSISDVNEAKRRRDEINGIMGEHIPDTNIPHDAPQTPPGKPKDYGIEPEFSIGTALTYGSIALGGLILYKILQK